MDVVFLRVTQVLKGSQGRTAQQDSEVSQVKEVLLELRYNQRIDRACE